MLRIEGGVKDYCAWNSSSTSLASSRTHTQSEVEVQRMRAQKIREEVAEKEKDEPFNIIDW
jgi:hypothetical protein